MSSKLTRAQQAEQLSRACVITELAFRQSADKVSEVRKELDDAEGELADAQKAWVNTVTDLQKFLFGEK